LLVDFFNWSGWEAVGVIVSIILGALTIWLTPRPVVQQASQTLETVEKKKDPTTDDEEKYQDKQQNPTVRRYIVVVILFIFSICSIWITFELRYKEDVLPTTASSSGYRYD
jgi:H+/gluconate symporter-like permease